MTNVLLRVLPMRYVVVSIAFFGFVINYMLRNNLNLAIVAMVNHTAVNSSGAAGSQTDGPFVWDEKIVALILGSFYYGYICTQVVGGRCAEISSVKYIYGLSLLTAGCLTFLIPTVSYWDYRALVAIRISMGFVLGVGFPSGYALLRAWAPPNERSTVVSLAISASNIGTAITMPLASAIINAISWEAVFYIQGSFALVWFVFWLLLVYNGPEEHPFITAEERDFIMTAIGSERSTRRLPLPWKEILTSPPVWSLVVANFCNNWGYYTLLNDLPQYFSNVLGKDISSNAIFTSLPFLVTFIFAMAYGAFSDYLRKNNLMSINNIRRMAQFVSQTVVAVTLVCIAFLGEHETLVEVLLFIGIGLIGAGYTGWQSVPVDMAPNYSGTLVGISNTFGSIPGFLAPLVVGALTEGHETLDRWRYCFLLPAAFMVFDTIIFFVFGSSEEQAWNRKYYNTEDEDNKAGGRDSVNLEGLEKGSLDGVTKKGSLVKELEKKNSSSEEAFGIDNAGFVSPPNEHKGENSAQGQ
ncbi:vesicular glutamate transporter 3-like [Pollicipes pollicipes]|uniref:vesicular glutamate transporter 3-like n=1 Tax=Pollicipes pollicipes TaxID=41117 RepID=UPI0018858C2E|nr:vesicular glutamate transporter 3-like [Pollicipes pollicipes]